MSQFKRTPGKPCNTCFNCPPDECRQKDAYGNTIFTDISVREVEWVLANMPSTLTYWNHQSISSAVNGSWRKITLYDFDQLNGTYVLEKDPTTCVLGNTIGFTMDYDIEHWFIDQNTGVCSAGYPAGESGTETINLKFGEDTSRADFQKWWLLVLDDSAVNYDRTANPSFQRFLDFADYPNYAEDCHSWSYVLQRLSPTSYWGTEFSCDDLSTVKYDGVDVTVSG